MRREAEHRRKAAAGMVTLEEEDPDNDTKPQLRCYNPLISHSYLRIAVAYIFIKVHKMAPPRKWHGKEGVIADIKKRLKMHKDVDVDSILKLVMKFSKEGRQYNGEDPKKELGDVENHQTQAMATASTSSIADTTSE